jgi:hypothetical protein
MTTLLDVSILRAPVPRPERTKVSVNTPVSLGTSVVATADTTPADATGDVPIDLAIPSVANASTVAPAIPPDALAVAIDRDDIAANTILAARCDDVARRIVREGGHISITTLAREVGTSPATLKRLMNTPRYRETYNRISDELLGTIDDRIADERLDTLVRSDTLQRRALTVLSEAMMIARGHMLAVAEGKVVARPQLLKVAVDAAAEVRQVVSARSAVGATGSTVNINITKNQATIIQGAIRESGIDLSDVLDGMFTDKHIDSASTPSTINASRVVAEQE